MDVSQFENEDHQPENGFVSPETTSPSLLSRIDGCVLPFLGGFGRYQKQFIVLTWIPALFIGFSQFSDNFLLAQANYTCIQPQINTTNLSGGPASLFNSLNNVSARAAHLSVNHTNNVSDNVQCMCTQWNYELHTGLVENVVTKWNLVCNSSWKVHIAKFSLLVGSIFGYLVLGVLADWFGRHPVLIVSVLFMLVFGLTVAFSVNVTMFSTLRFFEGFCLAGITLSLYVLRIELCLPGWRFSMTMVANFVVLGGQLLMPGLAAVCRDWQVLQAVIICPLLLMLLYIWIFPESLRWLMATQQYCRSKWIIDRIAKKNRANLERDADELLSELHRALQRKPKKTCIVKMVGTRNLWKNIVVLCVNSLTGYGIHHCFARSMMDQEAEETTMFHNFYADYYTMAGIAVASCMALCPAVGLMGRRGGLLMFMIITALASLLQLGLLNLLGKYSVQLNIDHSDKLKSNFSVAFSIIGMFSSHAVSSLSIFFCAEITPTVIRGGGLGLVLASAGFGMLTAPIMELHNQKGYFLHHIIFACCTLICIICILLLPETRYQPLPETLADGESYTRQPLLPPRKPGEQHLLLTKGESRDYVHVHDTPLHEAAALAVSTMESTASSAIDLTAPSVIDLSEQALAREAPGFPIQAAEALPLCSLQPALSGSAGGSVQSLIEERPAPDRASLTPSISDPLLTAISETTTPPGASSIHALKTDSPPTTPAIDALHPNAKEDAPIIDTQPPSPQPSASTDNAPPTSIDDVTVNVVSPIPMESTIPLVNDSSDVPAAVDLTGPLVNDILPPVSAAVPQLNDESPLSESDSPNDLVNDHVTPSTMDSPTPVVNDAVSPSTADEPMADADGTIPLCMMNLPVQSLPEPTPSLPMSSPSQIVNNTPPTTVMDSPDQLVNDAPPHSPTESSTPPTLDSLPPTVGTSATPSSPSIPPTTSPAPSSSTDSTTPTVLPSLPSLTMDSPSPPPAHDALPAAASTDSIASVGEDVADPPETDSTVPLSVDTGSLADASHPFTIALTVSSPIDSGFASTADFAIPDTSTANGVASS